ncbi:hypothetical protein RF55_10916 [Lasius niger]|uniref:Uncharacterized protein n=1 Tax=Lasius niger TaxID=67767 RepID=A0A0J7KGP9_LASNI|nr:hypothetical protein RF55_10916 [Lasius niger]
MAVSTTPMQLSRTVNTCAVTERGVPEGAASLPTRDTFQQTSGSANPTPHVLLMSNTYVDPNAGLMPTPTNPTNTVYYAMNV